MRFVDTEIAGVKIVEPERHADERGFFARVWCADELSANGLDASLVQCSVSYNRRIATLRGLHFQVCPSAESKLVRVNRGAIFDVAVDLRSGSPTFQRYVGVELSASNGLGLFIPEHCAHGFQTLVDDTEVLYFISTRFDASASRTVRWNDPALQIAWPLAEPRVISAKDAQAPTLHEFIRGAR